MRGARAAERAVAVAALTASWRSAASGTVGPDEERMFRVVNRAPDWIHIPVWAVMQAGSLAAVHVVALATARHHGRRRAIGVAVGGTAVWCGVKLVKPLVGRARPGTLLVDARVRGQAQTGLGWPSGHAAVSAFLATVTPAAGPAGASARLAFPIVTGLARCYVGAHLPADVIGGWAMGRLAGDLLARQLPATP